MQDQPDEGVMVPQENKMEWAQGIPFIGPALSFLGNRSARKAAQRQAAEQAAYQREFAQHGVRWRVEDAKAAGLHPLFALGSSGAQYSPVSEVMSGTHEVAKMGQDLTTALALQETPQQREDRLLRIRVAESQMRENDARAGYYSSLARKLDDNQGGRSPGVETMPPATRLKPDQVQQVPAKLVSPRADNPGIMAGPAGISFQEVHMPNGDRVLVPHTQTGQMPEDMDLWLQIETLGANLNKYGWRFIPDTFARWMGISPETRRGRTAEAVLKSLYDRARNMSLPRRGSDKQYGGFK